MTTAVRRACTVPAQAMFSPPSAPLCFADGDRYEWPRSGDVWERSGGHWKPSPEDGSGWLTDEEVRAQLHEAAANGDSGHRFIPVKPWRVLPLPGVRLHSPVRLEGLLPEPARHVAQYVQQHAGSDRLVPLRDLAAAYDEDVAHSIPATLTLPELRQVLQAIWENHARAQVSYDAAAGRLYARYELAPLDR